MEHINGNQISNNGKAISVESVEGEWKSDLQFYAYRMRLISLKQLDCSHFSIRFAGSICIRCLGCRKDANTGWFTNSAWYIWCIQCGGYNHRAIEIVVMSALRTFCLF